MWEYQDKINRLTEACRLANECYPDVRPQTLKHITEVLKKDSTIRLFEKVKDYLNRLEDE
jgi:hypothetical protein